MAEKPAWAAQLVQNYNAGISHAFILHGNVYDFVGTRVTLAAYLNALLGEQKLVFYSRAGGFAFNNTRVEAEFKKLAFPQPATPDAFSQTPSNPTLPNDPAEAIPLLGRYLANTTGAVIVIQDPQVICPPGDWATMREVDRIVVTTMAGWGRDLSLGTSEHIIILVSELLTDIHPFLRASRYEPIRIDLPAQAERLKWIPYFEQSAQEVIKWEPGFDAPGLAVLTGGLRLIDVDDILMRSLAEGQCSRRFAIERKRVIFESQYSDVIEPLSTDVEWTDIGGYEYVKKFLMEDVVQAFREGRFDEIPMGILLMGPAGTGKTKLMQALARAIGFQAVNFKVGRLTSMWQGEGERKALKATSALEAFAPVLVIMDELDQQTRRGGSSANEQDMRIFQILNEFIGDPKHRGSLLFCGASNRPDLIDAAMKRQGRFGDAKIPVLLPTESDRAAILRLLAGKFKLALLDNEIEEAAKRTNGYTGSELVGLMIETRLHVRRKLPPGDAIGTALLNVRPTTADIDTMTKVALAEVNNKRLLPPEYWDLWQTQTEVAPQTAPIVRKRRNLDA